MTEASLVAQKAIRGELIANSAVVALVAPARIVDRIGSNNEFPCILIGAAQVVDVSRSLDMNFVQELVYTDLHIYTREPSMVAAKQIAGAIKRCLRHRRLYSVDGTIKIDLFVESARFLRDPDGQTAHGIVTVQSYVDWRVEE